MTYSVWNPKTRKYAYYSANEAHADDTPKPCVQSRGKLGCALGQISWGLPPGAKPMGHGDTARGVVVHPGGKGGSAGGSGGGLVSGLSGLGGFEEMGGVPMVIMAGLLVLGVRAMVKK
jgi:hypothetical protein